MSWSCNGRLYSSGTQLDLRICLFLDTVIQHIQTQQVDVMWLSDAHILEGDMTLYTPYILRQLPDAKIIAFPTTRVNTQARCDSHNRMGGAVAIVTYKWKGYITQTYTDPMNLGVINVLYFKVDGLTLCCINAYFLPTTHGEGPATLHARIRRFLDLRTTSPRLRHLSPEQTVFTLVQKLISKARLASYPVFLHGDFNQPIPPPPQESTLSHWMSTNQLSSPSHQAFATDPTYYTRAGQTKYKATTIDHIMHSTLPSSFSVCRLATFCNFEITSVSDHLPLCITYAIANYAPRTPKRINIRPTKRVDINPTQAPTVDKYNAVLHTLLPNTLPAEQTTPDQSGHIIAYLCRASVTAVQSLTPNTPRRHRASTNSNRRTRHKLGRSAESRTRQSYMHFYTMLLRAAFPKGKRRRTSAWSVHSYRQILTSWITQWTIQHAPIHATMPPPTDLRHPRQLLSLTFEQISESYLQTQRTLIKRTLHGTLRTHMQRQANAHYTDVLQAHNSRSLGKVIQLLTCQPNLHCDLNTLHCPSEGQITEHFRIHNKVTEFFSQWYQAPTDMDPSTEALTITPDWWKQLLQPPSSEFKGLHPSSAIPTNLQVGLRKACAVKASPAIQQEIKASLDQLITFDEFSAAIDDLRAGSAPGPSETTPSMLLAWNPAIRQFIYTHVLHVWQHRSCPSWFKDKIIKLAPKVANSNDLNHMRPISLYEIVRKVWTTTVAKRIHLIWHHHRLLNPAQYGYRHDNGILMPLYNLLNTIEGAHTKATPTLITFWDMKRAFDSIPRNLQRLAWIWLGVPTDVAEWFASLDDGGLAYVDTPFFQTQKKISAQLQRC